MSAPVPFVIGVAGGSGSGKTTVTRRVMETVGQAGVAVLNQDNYYRDQSDIPFESRLHTNHDHPAAFDWQLLREHVDALMAGVPIEMPEYDFTQHTRAAQTTRVMPGVLRPASRIAERATADRAANGRRRTDDLTGMGGGKGREAGCRSAAVSSSRTFICPR